MTKKIEQEGFNMDYQMEMKRWFERAELYEQNKTKAYSTILGYCSKTIQNRVEEHPDYETMIRDDPIELLKAIKILMHDPVRARYPFASLTEAFDRVLNMKQREDEGLLDYTR